MAEKSVLQHEDRRLLLDSLFESLVNPAAAAKISMGSNRHAGLFSSLAGQKDVTISFEE